MECTLNPRSTLPSLRGLQNAPQFKRKPLILYEKPVVFDTKFVAIGGELRDIPAQSRTFLFQSCADRPVPKTPRTHWNEMAIPDSFMQPVADCRGVPLKKSLMSLLFPFLTVLATVSFVSRYG